MKRFFSYCWLLYENHRLRVAITRAVEQLDMDNADIAECILYEALFRDDSFTRAKR